MDFDVIQFYLDCPYKAFLSLSNKEVKKSEIDHFHSCAKKLLSDIFSDESIFYNKLKLNNHIKRFENRLLSAGRLQTPKDLFIRRVISSMKALLFSIDKVKILKVYGTKSYRYKTPNLDDVLINTCGSIEFERHNGNGSSRTFYVYDPFMSKEKHSNSLIARALHNAISDDRSIPESSIKHGSIIFLDSDKGFTYRYLFNQNGISSIESSMESILYALKLGISHPSPASYHCRRCLYRKSCSHSMNKTDPLDDNALTQKLLREKVKEANKDLLK